MADNFGHNQEQVEKPTFEAPQKLEKDQPLQQKEQLQKAEVREVADQFMKSVEGVEKQESAVDAMGNVSEEGTVMKEKAKGGSFGGTAQTTAAAALKPLKIPKVEVMRSQIAKEIKRQIRVLEGEASRIMMNPMGFNPFTLNGVVTKIRELKEMLANLAYVTLETLKSWWMKFVKNISI